MYELLARLNRLLDRSWHIFTVRGIAVRVHFLMLLWTIGEVLRGLSVPDDTDGATHLRWVGFSLGFLWGSILLHEFGHCAAAFRVGGSADRIVMWPLGGLASCQAPNTPLKQFIVAAGGPAVNVAIAAVTVPVLLATSYDWGIFWSWTFAPYYDEPLLGWLLKINLMLLFFNVIPAFPMDGGRILQCALWPRLGYHRATLVAVRLAQVCSLGLGILGIYLTQFLLVAIAIFIFISASQELRLVEAGVRVDEGVFGYDFSQGYTSLGMGQSQPPEQRPGLLARIRERRTIQRRERQREERMETRRRVDELLDKVHQNGLESLSATERQFLEKASQDYGK